MNLSAACQLWLRTTRLAAVLLAVPLLLRAADESGPVLFSDDFDRDLRQWSIEQMPGGSVALREGALVIEDVGGTTLWFRPRLTAPLEISYEVEVAVHDGPHDRLSDLNCFWMAQDPTRPAGALPAGRSGRFSDYDSLQTYYVGYGGNNNTTSRFRRYDGTSARPLLPQHDLSAADFLLVPNHVYNLRIVVRDGGTTEFWRDGEKIFSFTDPHPLTTGYFAFRTVQSHQIIRHFKISRLSSPAT